MRENVHHAWKVKTPGECVLRVEAGKRCLVAVVGAGASTTVVVSAKGTEEATVATAGRRGVSAGRRVCLCLEVAVVVLTGVAEEVGAVAPLGKSWRGWNLWENRLSFDFFG